MLMTVFVSIFVQMYVNSRGSNSQVLLQYQISNDRLMQVVSNYPL